MRLRVDSWWEAGRKRAVLLGAVPDPRQDDSKNWAAHWLACLNDDSFEPAMPGDVWEVRQSPDEPGVISYHSADRQDWLLTGYGLWCPNEKCHEGMHSWTHAHDCPARFHDDGLCKTGEKQGVQSCWIWSGSIEAGDLTASPSLFIDDASCGWHGFLQQGQMNGWIEAKYQ